MRRVFLPLSMVLSLWPIGVIGVGVVNSGTNQKPASVSNPTPTVSPSAPAQSGTDYATINRLVQRESSLLSRARNSSAFHGIPDPSLSRDANNLAADERAWMTTNAGRDAHASLVADREAVVTDRVAAFSSQPRQARLDALNCAIADYNGTIKAH